MIEQYVHHGCKVSVQTHLKGKHQEHCLCHQGCKFFLPGAIDNCEIAQANFELCKTYNTVQPVWECKKYERE